MPGVPDTPLISLDHEELVIRRGRRSGVYTIVAVHSTALGPALGGCRMWRYESSADGARDALRLSRAMTFKTAACGLNVGGGKGVICLEPGRAPTGKARRDVLLDFADTIEVLEGNYITAEDVGTGPKDMAVIAAQTKYVTGLGKKQGGSGDPSPYTAMGVEAAMRACCESAFGSPDLQGRKVAIIGADAWAPSWPSGSRKQERGCSWRTSTTRAASACATCQASSGPTRAAPCSPTWTWSPRARSAA
jgi:leucine dehydrogenase